MQQLYSDYLSREQNKPNTKNKKSYFTLQNTPKLVKILSDTTQQNV